MFAPFHSRLFAGALRLSALCLTGGLFLCNVFAEDKEAAGEEAGLKVGEHAPAFTLKDQNGHEVSLESLLKKGPVALVFYRSAGWCMFCKFQLVHLQHNAKDFEAAGGQLVGISYDSPRVLKRFADTQHITFPLLSDEGGKAIAAYHAQDTTPAAATKPGLATHVALVLDRTGMVRAKFLGVIDEEQPGVSRLLKAVREAADPQPERKKVEGG